MPISFTPKIVTTLVTLSIFLIAWLHIDLKMQTTMIGYEIGELKRKEIALLKKRNLLDMQLAKMTTKSSLLKSLDKSSKHLNLSSL